MNVTTPQQMLATNESLVETAIAAFEKKFEKEEKGGKYYHLVITGELMRSTCEAVEEIYQNAGWDATCRTSSENGERPGLTGLILKTKNK